MLRIFFQNDSANRLNATLRGLVPRITEAIRKRLDEIDAKLQRKIQTEKLQGQVLHHRTGKLINSIRMIPAKVAGSKVAGYVEGGGGPAWYGKIHEYGTDRAYEIVPVNKKALAFMLNGKQVFAKKVLHPSFAEKSFMRSSLDEMREQIHTELQEAVNEVMRKPS